MTGEAPLYRRYRSFFAGAASSHDPIAARCRFHPKGDDLASKKIDFKSIQPPFAKRGQMV
jgi:hypothetical protein